MLASSAKFLTIPLKIIVWYKKTPPQWEEFLVGAPIAVNQLLLFACKLFSPQTDPKMLNQLIFALCEKKKSMQIKVSLRSTKQESH